MSRLETLVIEWFTLEEKLPTKGEDIFLKSTKDIIQGRYLFTEIDKSKPYMLLNADNSYIEIYIEDILSWAYYVYSKSL